MAYNHGGQYQEPASSMRLKPMFNADTTSLHSGLSDEYYKPIAAHPLPDAELARLESRDQRLKYRIRVLRLISRVVAAILSATTLAPLAMTIIKFLQTRNVYYEVDGKQRTAWANDTITWYTYMYFGVALVSFVFNAAILIAYWKGVKQANSADKVAGWWSHLIMVFHIVVWGVSAGLYRYGKEPVNGKFRDLWGWTCSTAAEELQPIVTDVKFALYCNVQSTSFYSGLTNVGTGLLSALIYLLALQRVQSKKRVQTASYSVDEAREPLRS